MLASTKLLIAMKILLIRYVERKSMWEVRAGARCLPESRGWRITASSPIKANAA
jgi:hypothetical protein